MSTAIVLLTRDLRVHDNPALHAAVESADSIVPLFVVDDAIRRSSFTCPNRAEFLARSLADLDSRLRRRGGALVVRRGDVAEQVARVAGEVDAAAVHVADDYSRYATSRRRRLTRALDRRPLIAHASHVAVAPGEIAPTGAADHFSVFSAYHRRWERVSLRRPLPAPERIALPDVDPGPLPSADDICPGPRSARLLPGGETAGRERVKAWFDGPVVAYGSDNSHRTAGRDDLATEGTSRLSPYLHFGCVSVAELVDTADPGRAGVQPFLRQLAWRDFHHQVLAARPDVRDTDYRSRGDHWDRDEDSLSAWKAGRTGYPLVDAGMRQLRDEGWMHNRARLVAGSFLTKHLYLDWRVGAQHFFDHLLDGDIANNCLNWQWVAGTGTDTRPNRVLNPTRQAERYDATAAYVRRWLPELGTPDYPAPLVDHAQAAEAFKRRRASARK